MLTQSRKVAEKRVVFGRFYYPFALFAPLREMNSTFSISLLGSEKAALPATVTPACAGVQWLCLDSRESGNDTAELILLRALTGEERS